ncbi:MAG: glycosyltransferase family 2 protein [Chloroflexi bacterium]|nr:glycosyltransferase family 2 protein [Chloroflexota bacterium]
MIIVNWNTRDLLDACLSSVYATGAGLAYEVLVVDNASSDGSAAMVRDRYPQALLIENRENRGFAAANNQALPVAQGRHLLLLNSDTRVHEGALQRLVALLDTRPLAGGVGARLLNGDGSLQPSCHPVLTPWREFWRLLWLDHLAPQATYAMQRWDLQTPREIEVIKGACLLLRAEAVAQVGPLDERYFMYTEEMDLCARLLAAGWRCYWEPRAVVTHYGESSTRQVADEMYVQLYRSKAQFQRKFGGQRRARLYRVLLAIAYLSRWLFAALAGLVSPAMAARRRTFGRLLAALPEF